MSKKPIDHFSLSDCGLLHGRKEMKPRKIVQVEAVDPRTIVALSDDGSLWQWHWLQPKWVQFPPLPPIEEPEGECADNMDGLIERLKERP